MTDPILQMHLPAFMIVSSITIFFWHRFRKAFPSNGTLSNEHPFNKYSRFKRINPSIKVVFGVFILMIVIYSYYPQGYSVFIPLDIFHHPVINMTGLLILKVALVFIVIAQLHLDNELYKFRRNVNDLSSMELVRHYEIVLTRGILVLFVGTVVTITNVVGIILTSIAFSIYYRAMT